MFFTIVRILIITLCCSASGLHAVAFLQGEKYQTKALWEHFKKPLYNPIVSNVLPAALAMLLDWYLPVLLSMAIVSDETRTTLCGWLVLAFFAVAGFVVWWRKRSLPLKRHFTLTRRALRLLIVSALLNLLGSFTMNSVAPSPYIFYVVADYVVWFAALLMRPIENGINARHFKAAKTKLDKRRKLIRIGISGSYGKTETKQILKTLLAEKYEVLATPPAFSTAVGIARIVNEQLGKEHRVFIAELGGESREEMRQMTQMLKPRYGILTSIGLRRGGYDTIEKEAQINYELIRRLPEDGAAFFGAEGSYLGRLYAICKKKKFRCGMAAEGIDPDIRVEDAQTGINGTDFTLIVRDGEQRRMHTRLIGRFSLRNIALCAGVAIKLGLTMDEIAQGVDKLRPLHHHLELIDGDVHIIDDSDNENPEAAEAGLNVLEKFPGRRILLTGGFENPFKDNAIESACYGVGQRAAKAADYIILVGREDTAPIMQGLVSEGFPQSEVRIVEYIDEATDILNEITTKGDSVLWEGITPVEDA